MNIYHFMALLRVYGCKPTNKKTMALRLFEWSLSISFLSLVQVHTEATAQDSNPGPSDNESHTLDVSPPSEDYLMDKNSNRSSVRVTEFDKNFPLFYFQTQEQAANRAAQVSVLTLLCAEYYFLVTSNKNCVSGNTLQKNSYGR